MEKIIEHNSIIHEPTFVKYVVEAATQTEAAEVEVQELNAVI